MMRLKQHVEGKVVDRASPTFALVDLPNRLADLAGEDLREVLTGTLAQREWIDDEACREMAERLGSIGWVAQVHYVRRTSDARFEVSCRYRQPFAMVQRQDQFFFVDVEGVRLPGRYLYSPTWRLIQGVGASTPDPGQVWPGDDLQAGVKVLRALEVEPYSQQVTAVLVDNFAGRVDSRAVHIELATDRAGGRIRWGSAPGRELEENSIAQKLAILRENYRRTGRADANNPIIDISTFPDRFAVPG
ncbi:MAG: hypothetical protein JSU63_06890 [Phycisphaerales bacterium]|nr:MAG: hypothetical protein JSU63_06890 [Phycisphaerales bacterium]